MPLPKRSSRPYLLSMATRANVIVSDVAVVGGGFCGALVAAHLLKQSRGQVRVALIERSPRLARGVAYSTPYTAHLLNVPAGRMSAWPDEPDHFIHWWQEREPTARANDFAPRQVYGEYLTDQLRAAHSTSPSASWRPLLGDVMMVAPRPDGVMVRTREGGLVWASRVVLALGNLPPSNPSPVTKAIAAHPAYRRDPWELHALDNLAPDAPVFLIGTGLTMVDVALALVERGHRGPMFALSRRGLLPEVHATTLPQPPPVLTDPSLMGVLRWVRKASSVSDWRAVVDSLRSISGQLWQGFTMEEKRRFLRHLRPYWDVHRHRMAPIVGAAVEAMKHFGALRVAGGRIVSITPEGEGLSVVFRRRGTEELESFWAARVINCTGPASDITRTGEPVLDNLLKVGDARPDTLRLGLDVTAEGRLIDANDTPSERLFAVGPLCRGRLWEATAVPELRVQAAELAALLLHELGKARTPSGELWGELGGQA